MFIVESYAVAIIMCFITMICCKRKLTAVCSHQTRIGNLDAHLI